MQDFNEKYSNISFALQNNDRFAIHFCTIVAVYSLLTQTLSVIHSDGQDERPVNLIIVSSELIK